MEYVQLLKTLTFWEMKNWGKNGLKIKEPFKFITGTTRLDEILNIPVNASKKI